MPDLPSGLYSIAAGISLLIVAFLGLRAVFKGAASKDSSYMVLDVNADDLKSIVRGQMQVPWEGVRGSSGASGPLGAFASWASGASELGRRMDDLVSRQRALEASLLGLDARYIRRDEAAWLVLQILAVVVGLAASIATIVWGAIELTR